MSGYLVMIGSCACPSLPRLTFPCLDFLKTASNPALAMVPAWARASARGVSNEIEFSCLNGNLMVRPIPPLTLDLTAILLKADNVSSFVSSNE
jgi:hypothetical protein